MKQVVRLGYSVCVCVSMCVCVCVCDEACLGPLLRLLVFRKYRIYTLKFRNSGKTF